MYPIKIKLYLFISIIVLLTSCSSIIENAIPDLEIVGPAEIIKFEMPPVTIPGIGTIGTGNETGSLVIRLPVEATNANPSPLRITKIEYDAFLKDKLLATGIQDDRVEIDSSGTSRFDVDVTVPIDDTLAASLDLIAFATGTPTPIRVNVVVTVDILGITKVSVKKEVFNKMVTAPPLELPF